MHDSYTVNEINGSHLARLWYDLLYCVAMGCLG
jgi:hypothetical protein